VSGGGSGNPVVFIVDAASAPGVCSVSGPDGATLSYLEAGTCVVDANQAGSSQWAAGPQVQARVAVAAVASSPPTGVGASISTAITTITVTWTAPSDDGGSPIGGYQVFRSTTPGQQGTLIATVTWTPYTDTTAVRLPLRPGLASPATPERTGCADAFSHVEAAPTPPVKNPDCIGDCA
jgi:hypothetical protein